MSTEIDRRVVEMQFNNKDFEKNAQTSLTTIEKLKMALNFDGAKGLESLSKAANKVDLSNISKSADAVAVKFSAMQIAGVTAIQQLTLSFMNFGKNLWANSIGQIKSGGMARALKIEQANFQMRALANNMYDVETEADKINTLLDDMSDAIDRSVTGTAYGYDAAAKVASQLMASGLTDSETMYNHLRAIAGAAAMTGRDFENMGDIFTKVASNGRLMTMELRQFAAAGLNMSSVLADYFGTTEQAVNDMVHDGQVSFEQFSDAVYKAFGDMAGKADETFSGVSKNVKAQLSRIGQLFAQPYIKNMIPFLVTVKAKLKEINAALAPIANTFDYVFGKIMTSAKESLEKMDLYRFNAIFGGIENILTSIFLIAVQVKRAFDEVFPKKTLDELHEMAIEFNNMTLSLIPGPETLSGLKELVKLPLIIAKMILKAIKSVLKGLGPIISAVKNLLGAIVRFGEVFMSLNTTVLDTVNNTSILETIFVSIGTVIGYVINLIANLVDVLRTLFTKALNSSVFQSILSFLSSVIDAIGRGLAVALYLIVSIIGYIFSILDFDKIISAIKGVKGVAVTVFGYLANFLKFIITFIFSALTGIASIGKGIEVISEYFKKGINNIKSFFGSIKEGGKSTENVLDSMLDAFIRIKERFDGLFEGLTAGKVLLIAFGVGVVLLVFALEKLIKNLADLARHANVAFSVFDILKNGIARAVQISPMLQVLIGIGIAIGAVTASIITLGRDLSSEELKRSVTALSIFIILLTTISVIILKMGKSLPKNSEAMKGIVGAIGAFSIGILALALSLKILTSMQLDIKNLVISLAAITVLIGELGAIALLLGQNFQKIDKEKEELKYVSINFIGLALSILTLTGAFKMLSAVNPERVLQAIVSFTTVMGMFSAALLAAGYAANKGFGFKAGLGVTLLVHSLTTIFLTLLALSFIPFDTLGKSILKMLAVMVPLAAFIVVIGEVILKGSKLDKSRNIEVLNAMTKMLGLFAMTMAELTIIVGVLGRMSLTNLLKGVAAVTVMSLLIELVVSKFISVADKMFKEFGKTKDGYKNFNASLQNIAKMISSFALIMVAISVSAMMLDNVSIVGFIGASLAFGEVVFAMQYILREAEKTKDAKMGPLLALAISILALMSALTLISYSLKGKNLDDTITNMAVFVGAATAISMVLLAFSVVLEKITANNFDRPQVVKTFKAGTKNVELLALGMAAMILAIAGIGLAYKNANIEQMYYSAIILVEVLAAMGMVIVAIKKLSDLEKGQSAEDAAKIMQAQTDRFKAVYSFLIGISAFVLSMSAAVALLSYVLKDNVGPTLGASFILFGSLITILIMLTSYVLPELQELAKDISGTDKFAETFDAISNFMMTLIKGMIGLVAVISIGSSLVGYTDSTVALCVSIIEMVVLFGGLLGPIMVLIEQMKEIDENKFNQIMSLIQNLRDFANSLLTNLSLLTAVIAATGSIMSFGNDSNSMIKAFGGVLFIMLGIWAMIITFSKMLGDKDISILQTLEKFMIGFGASVALMAAGLVAIALAFNSIYDAEIIIASLVALGGIITVLTSAVIVLSKFVESNDVKTLLAGAGSIVIITLSLIAIVKAISMLYETMSKDTNSASLAKAGKMFGSFAIIIVSLMATTGAVIALSKFMNGTKVVNVAVVSLLVATIAAAIVAISGAIKLLDNVNIGPGAAASFVSMGAILAIMISVITGISKDANFAVMLSASALVMSIAATAVAFAISMKTLIAAFDGVTTEKMNKIISALLLFETLVSILVITFGLLGVLVGDQAIAVSVLVASFAGAVASFGLSAALFGVGIYILAEGVNRLVEIVQTINNLEIDANRVHDNIQKGIMGFATGIWDSLGYIAQAIAAIVLVIFEVLLGSIGAIVGIATILMTGFVLGIVEALPIILAALSVVLAEITAWFMEEENMQLMYDAGFVLGEAITKGILGALAGVLDGIKDEVNKWLEWLGLTSQKLSNLTFENFVKGEAFDLTSDETYEDGTKRTRGRYKAKRERYNEPEIRGKYSEVEDKSREIKQENNNKKAQKEFEKLKNRYKEYKDVQGEVTLETRQAAKANEHLTLSYIDLGQEASNDNKIHIDTSKSMQTLASNGDNVTKVVDNIGDAMENTSNKTGVFTRGLESVKDTVKDSAADIAKDAGTELVNNIGNGLVDEFAPDIVEKLKNKFGDTLDWNLVGDVLTGKVDKSELFKSFLSNGIFSAEAFKTGVSSGLSDLASMFGIDLSNVKTYEQWEAYGNEKAYHSGHVERWRAEGYKSASDYADDMQKKYGTAGENIMKAFFGDSNPLSDLTKSSEDAIKNMTDSLNGLGEAEDEAKKKTDELADAIKNTIDIFTEFDDTAQLKSKSVLKSFMSQLTGVSKWSKELKALKKKGFSSVLLEDLANLGPQGYEKVHALYTMTDKEMSLFNKMYAEKLSIEESTADDIRKSFEDTAEESVEAFAKSAEEGAKAATANGIKQVSDGIVSEIAAVPQEAGTLLGEAAYPDSPIPTAFAEMGLQSMEAFKKQMNFEEALEAVKTTFQAGIKDATTLGSSLFEELGESEEISAKKMLDNMQSQVKNVGEWVTEINTLVSRGASEGLVNMLLDMGPQGKSKVDAFIKMTDSQLKEANRLYEASAKLPQTSADRITSSYAKAGYMASLGFTEGIDPEAAQEAMIALADHSVGYLEKALDINSPSRRMMEVGKYAVLGFIEGVLNTVDTSMNSAMYKVSQKMVSSLKLNLKPSSLQTVGKDLMTGLSNGIIAAAEQAVKAAAEAAKKVTDAVKNVFDSHSPSIVFTDIGRFLMIGLANGIDEAAPMAKSSAAEASQGVLDEFLTDIASIDAESESAYAPVVRPVLDIQNITSGYDDIREWFNNQAGLDMTGNIRFNPSGENANSDVNRIVDAINNQSNKDVVNEIASLRNDISSLQDAMTRMQVVMDTGTLVGSLVQPMDAALGARAVTNSRGRYS